MPAERQLKVLIIGAIVALTVAIHYGLILEPIFGQAHWIHAVHGRFCYIPIVIAAAWFGVRGGVYAAAAISLLVLPFIIGGNLSSHNLAQELVEIVFYFAIALLAGWLFQRELLLRRKQEQTQIQLERSHKLSLVGQMAASVAHEIKNPLASIKGALEILSDDSTSAADRAEFRETATKEIRRIDGTISEFLEFARPRRSEFKKLNLSNTLRTSLKQIEVHASKAGLQFVDRIKDNVYIHGDREKIHQVILNLLINSIQASSSGSAIEIHLDETKEDRATMTIRDHGKGMAPEELDRIFEPFYSTKPAGTGLGLAIVKGIVENHRGKISFDSAPGHGTTATVAFPAYED
jgi:signal transduction histidine kinase